MEVSLFDKMKKSTYNIIIYSIGNLIFLYLLWDISKDCEDAPDGWMYLFMFLKIMPIRLINFASPIIFKKYKWLSLEIMTLLLLIIFLFASQHDSTYYIHLSLILFNIAVALIMYVRDYRKAKAIEKLMANSKEVLLNRDSQTFSKYYDLLFNEMNFKITENSHSEFMDQSYIDFEYKGNIMTLHRGHYLGIFLQYENHSEEEVKELESLIIEKLKP